MYRLLTFAGPLSPQVVLCSPDGLLYNCSDLELYCRRIPGQQQPVEHVEELHCQQLQEKKTTVPVKPSETWILIFRERIYLTAEV